MEMIGGGEDAELRHFGHSIKQGIEVNRVSEAPIPSLLSCIHAKLPIVASSRQAYAFEDEFDGETGPQRCWVTLLPLSANGTWIDFVYGVVSLEGGSAAVEEVAAAPAADAQDAPDPFAVELRPYDEGAAAEPAPGPETPAEPEYYPEPEPEAEPEAAIEPEPEPEPVAEVEPDAEAGAVLEPEPEPEPAARVGFSS